MVLPVTGGCQDLENPQDDTATSNIRVIMLSSKGQQNDIAPWIKKALASTQIDGK